MHRDPEIAVIQLPETLKHEFRLRARVDKDNTHPRLGNPRIDLVERMPRHMAGPGDAVFGLEDINYRWSRLRHRDNFATAPAQPVARQFRPVNRSRQPNPRGPWRQRGEAGEIEAQQIAALVVEKGVKFIDDDKSKAAEIGTGILIGQQQGKRLRGRHQEIRGFFLLSLAPRLRSISSTGLETDR